MKQYIFLALKGAAMGIAETIPGVSGGTIAFITGIYERLLNSIRAFEPGLIGVARKEGIRGVWQRIDGTFLTMLLGGMVIGLGLGLVGVAYFLEQYPPVVWAFFFGLILASIVYVAGQIKGWNYALIGAFIAGAVVAFGITQLPIGQANDSLWFVFFCGAVAVSALMLPGISGSFILLLLGMYQFILHDTLKDGVIGEQDSQAILIMAVFGLGMVLGLASFSRVLSWALKQYHGLTLAVLAGFMLGALPKIWPWRIPTLIMTEAGEVVDFAAGMEVDKVIKEVNVLPAKYSLELGEPAFLAATIVSLVVGFVFVLYLDRSSKVKI